MHIPKTAYILLWFPLSSETFVFREVVQLMQRGLPVHVYTVYGQVFNGCSQEMRDFSGPLMRLGVKAVLATALAFARCFCRAPLRICKLMGEGLFRRMRCWETLGENALCFMAGFRLAEMFRKEGIELITTPWANGPGTAAWIASRLTGIPFVLTGRAGDIHPPDGLLSEKLRDATLVRTNNAANVGYLQSHCPPSAPCSSDKIRLVYNSLTLGLHAPSPVPMQPPYRLLAVGRLVRTKGFDVLLEAMALLRAAEFPCRLTLVGDGSWRDMLHRQAERLGLGDRVEWPGFVPNDRLLEYIGNHDMLVVPSVVDKTGDRDGIPNVIMEALSSGLPVIATDVCGIGEVVRDQETGLLIAERDPEAIATAVRAMAADREAALCMAQAGKELVRKMFDAESNITQLLGLYVQAWEQGGAATSKTRVGE